MFIISTYLARINETARLKEFTNKNYFELAKFCVSEEKKNISIFFEESLRELILNEEIYSKLTCVEKFIIWLDIYRNCVHDSISFTTLGSNASTQIKNLINKINIKEFIQSKTININDMEIVLNSPSLLYVEGVDDILESVLYCIKYNNQSHYYKNFTAEERNLFLNSLPSNVFSEIIEYYNSISKEIINIAPQSSSILIPPLNVSINGNIMLEFLISIFKNDISTHYSNALIFMKQFNGDLNSYFNITPKDFFSLYKVYEKSLIERDS